MMTLSNTAGTLSSWLRTRHIKVLPEWTEACVDWIQNECQGGELSLDRLKEVVYDQWLDSDLAEIATPSLPEGLAQVQKRGFRGAFALQINSIQDVGSSAYSQLVKIKGKENENVSVTATQATQSRFEPKPSRMLMMQVTDGHQMLQAMEYQPIAALNADTPPGTKIIVHGDLMCRLGVLTLTRDHVTVLGGEVESLIEENRQDKLLARIIGTSLDDIPGGPAKTVQPQDATARQRDAHPTVNDRQQPAVSARRLPAQRGNIAPSPVPEPDIPEDDFPEDIDDDVLAGIDEEILREIEQSESSRPNQQRGNVKQQPPPPEWPSDEDTDEEMLAAMMDNIEEHIKARGDATSSIATNKRGTTRLATSRVRNPNPRGKQSQRPQSSTADRKPGDASMRQAPISSFLRPKCGINKDAIKRESTSTHASSLSALDQGLSLSSSACVPSSREAAVDKQRNGSYAKSGAAPSQFSPGPRHFVPPAERKASSFSSFKAAPVEPAFSGVAPGSGFVKAQGKIVSPELNRNHNSDHSAVTSIPPQEVPARAKGKVHGLPLKCGPPQTSDPRTNGQLRSGPFKGPGNPPQGVFIKAGSSTSAVSAGEKSTLPPGGKFHSAGTSTVAVKPFAQTSFQHPKVAVATRFSKEAEEERNKLSLKRRRNSSSTGPAPFRYLSDAMESITTSTETFTFDIRGFIMTLLSSLSKEGDQWSLRVKLNDGSASIDAVLGDEVLQGLIGFSVTEMKEMRATVQSQEEKESVEAVQKNALDQCRKKLVDLCEVMTIRVTPGESPTVIATRRVEQTDIDRMKKCLD